jgi:hypothetical protein
VLWFDLVQIFATTHAFTWGAIKRRVIINFPRNARKSAKTTTPCASLFLADYAKARFTSSGYRTIVTSSAINGASQPQQFPPIGKQKLNINYLYLGNQIWILFYRMRLATKSRTLGANGRTNQRRRIMAYGHAQLISLFQRAKQHRDHGNIHNSICIEIKCSWTDVICIIMLPFPEQQECCDPRNQRK